MADQQVETTTTVTQDESNQLQQNNENEFNGLNQHEDSIHNAQNFEINETGNHETDENDKNNEEDELEPEIYRKMFIGTLTSNTTDDILRSYFSQFGDILNCVVIKDPQTNKSRGFGFVTFSKSFMVDNVMKNRPHKLDGKDIETKRATPREDSGKPGAERKTNKLFIGAIKDGLTEDNLKEYFSPYGNITDCIIMREKDTNKLRGFGFVTFDDYDPVDKIVLEKYHTINGQSVAVNKALRKDETNRNKGPGGFNYNNMPPNFAIMAQKMFEAAAGYGGGGGGSGGGGFKGNKNMNFASDDFEGFNTFGGSSNGGGPLRGGNRYRNQGGNKPYTKKQDGD